MSTFTREGGRLGYDVTGEALQGTVVCVPGMGDLRSQYRHLTPQLVAAGWQVVTLDLRGHGESTLDFDEYGPHAVGGDILALLDHLGVERAVVAGNSAAGASAVWAAAEAPDRVSGLVLLGPVVRDVTPMPSWLRALMSLAFRRPWGPWLWTLFYGSLFKGGAPADHAQHVLAVRANARRPGRLRATFLNGMSSKAPCAARLPEVRCPSLVVMGSADPDFPDAAAEAQEVSGLLGGRAVVLDGVGHYPHLERAEVTGQAVVAFLEEVACHAA